MITAQDLNCNMFIANKAQRVRNYYCKHCGSDVILKKGNKKIHHFAHKQKNTCSYSGESLAHLEAKYSIYNKLKSIYGDIEIEKKLAFGSVPDVYIPSRRIAIEVQKSRLSKDEFRDRTRKYKKNSIIVVWVFLYSKIRFDGSSVIMNKMMRESYIIYNKKLFVYDKSWNHIECWKLGDLYSYSEYFDQFGELNASERWLRTRNKINDIKKYYLMNSES